MGCASERVERPEALGDALDRALRSERPIVLDVVTSMRPTFRDVTSPLAARSCEGLGPDQPLRTVRPITP